MAQTNWGITVTEVIRTYWESSGVVFTLAAPWVTVAAAFVVIVNCVLDVTVPER